MADVSMSTLVTGFVSAVVSSVLTYLGARSKIRLDLTVEYDKQLHDKRLELYRALWPRTKSLARYARASPLTYALIRETAEEMRDWYFDKEGGIYLSRRSRKPYFELKKKMQRAIDEEKPDQPDGDIDKVQCDAILAAASRLRNSLADDIGTRRAPWL